MKRRKFKDASLQKVYDQYRDNPPSRTPRVLGSDYWRGFDHPERGNTLAPRGSLIYAAWAAGVDAARDAAKELGQ
jgi:hypothetical protein